MQMLRETYWSRVDVRRVPDWFGHADDDDSVPPSIDIHLLPDATMDGLNISPETGAALQNMSAKDKQELNQFIVNESQKAQIQSTIHGLTDTCFRKCITSKISSGKLDRSEEPCMANCVDRFMDANMTVIKHLEQMRTL
nr:mitochondrial import inner membrane translocase subunit tim8 [Quercus suber]